MHMYMYLYISIYKYINLFVGRSARVETETVVYYESQHGFWGLTHIRFMSQKNLTLSGEARP